MVTKMNPFSILDQCPQAASFIASCKSNSQLKVDELPKPKFIKNNDGTVEDIINGLLWMQTEIPDQKKTLTMLFGSQIHIHLELKKTGGCRHCLS